MEFLEKLFALFFVILGERSERYIKIKALNSGIRGIKGAHQLVVMLFASLVSVVLLTAGVFIALFNFYFETNKAKRVLLIH